MSKCNKKPIRQGLPTHKELLDQLNRGVVKFKLQKDQKFIYATGTLNENILPAKESEYYRILRDQEKNNNVTFWSFNRNFENGHAKESGWATISLDKIIDTDYIGDINLGDDYDAVSFTH
jgi:hypothetical protein|tara:strand:- start:30 stop:389 length:360 start_codon:yes stop_codon:yes gene_type:complete